MFTWACGGLRFKWIRGSRVYNFEQGFVGKRKDLIGLKRGKKNGN